MKLRPLLAASAAAFALLACAPTGAQQSTPAPVAEVKVPAADKEIAELPGVPAMWKVADEDTTLYLFGTIHILPDDVDWNSGAVETALAQSDVLVTEINMTPEVTQGMGKLVNDLGMLPAGTTLRSLMNEDELATYEAGLAKIGVPAASFDAMEPWLASIAILQIVAQASGFSEDQGVETVLENSLAEGTGRVALETIEFQLSVFDGLPMDQQMAYLLEGAADPIEGIKTLSLLVDIWSNGDTERLGELMNEGLTSHPGLADRLLYQRNAKWADWIDTRLDEPGTVFIAVGAGHLAGDKSVQDYLAERDIAVTRVQ